MDAIHGIRDANGADVVVLLINNTEYCGLADAILTTADTAFACVHQPGAPRGTIPSPLRSGICRAFSVV